MSLVRLLLVNSSWIGWTKRNLSMLKHPVPQGDPDVKLSKQAMVNSAIRTGDFFDVQIGDSALHCLP